MATKTMPTLNVDFTRLGAATSFQIFVPLDAPDDLAVGDRVRLYDDGVEPEVYEVTEMSANGEVARFRLVA